jgi:hypothetical protein
MTQTTNFENLHGFEFSAMSTPTFSVKKTFQKASERNDIFSCESVILRPKHLPFTTMAVVFLEGL